MASIFTKIINGEIPSYKIAENEHYFAFLDINPLHKGHTLVIPKVEVDYLFDLPEDVYEGLFKFSRIAVIGLEVPHAHIHLVPINEVHDIDFKKPRVTLTKEQFAEIAR